MKGMVYRSCVRSAMLYGSEIWCLRENEMAILMQVEKESKSVGLEKEDAMN
mgnify:CR=1 FL=1